MKIPLTWLREYVDLTLPPAQLVERLTLAGLEVAGVASSACRSPTACASSRKTWPRLGPRQDRRRPGSQRRAASQRRQAQAADRRPGARARPSSSSPAPRTSSVGDTAKKSSSPCPARCCSTAIPPNETQRTQADQDSRRADRCHGLLAPRTRHLRNKHEGIILLEDDAPVGTPLADFMGDIVLEIDVLPNMARCLSMIGVAREVAAITGAKLKLPAAGMQATGEPIDGQVKVEIEDPKLSARYAAALIKDVKIGPAPGWMQRRLPLRRHAADQQHRRHHQLRHARMGPAAARLRLRRAGEARRRQDADDHRPARAGRRNPGHARQAGTQVDAGESGDRRRPGPIALAGVMGGRKPKSPRQTKNILLESASFDFVSIRRTMPPFRSAERGERRFSRGIHPETVQPAAERAADLMRQFAGGSVCAGLVDCYPAPRPPQVDRIPDGADGSLARLQDRTGRGACASCGRWNIKVERPARTFAIKVTVPTHRLDVQEGTADLVEDIVRIYGYDRVPTTLLAEPLPKQQANEPIVFEEKVRDILVDVRHAGSRLLCPDDAGERGPVCWRGWRTTCD